MDWNKLYIKDNQPDLVSVANFIKTPLWNDLCTYLENSYGVSPKIEHSICSAAPGWNLKYKKSGRSLCTLYPNDGFFTCMVSIGNREAMEAELILSGCTEYIQKLYWRTNSCNGSRWLMIDVTTPEILADTKALINLRTTKK